LQTCTAAATLVLLGEKVAAYALAMSVTVFGRDAELRALGAFLDGLPADSGAFVLAGAAGAGKTTLLRAGAALAAERGYTVLQTMPARSDMRLAFAGLADLLEPYLPDVIVELAPPLARALRVALLLEEAPSHPPEQRVIAAAFRAAVTTLARSAPVLLVIDDVQWLDPASEAAVGFAIRRVEHEAVGLLCAQRVSGLGENLPLELDRARLRAGLLPVGGLSLGALHRLLRTRLGASFSHPALRRIEAGSGGNPFIAIEIGRALARRGVSSVGSAVMPVPETLGELVDERLGALAPDVIDALRLVAVMPDAPTEQYLACGAEGAALDTAVRAAVLEHGSGPLRFTHPLLASAVASAIPPARKRELHAVAASVVQLPEERARHHALAASGQSAPVADELTDAGHAAGRRGAPAAAAELFELAAALTPDKQPAEARHRLLDAARQLALAGETRAATAILERLIVSTPPGPERSDALSEYGKLRQDDFGAAETLLDQALAEAGDDRERKARIRSALSHLWLMRGDAARALAVARLALPDAEAAGSPAVLAHVLARNFDLGLMHGDSPDEDLLARALQLERTIAAPSSETPPSLLAGMWHLHEGSLDLAEKELQHVLARAEAEGIEYWRAESLLRLSQVAARRGDAARAAELAAESLEVAEQLELAHMTCAALHGCASAALLLGDADSARELAIRGAEFAERTPDPPFVVLHEALLGSIDLALGDYPAAAARLTSLLSRLHVLGVRPTTQAIRADAAEALVAVGELDDAAMIVSELERSVREPVTAAIAARCRGILAAGSGDTDGALAELTAALRLHEQVSPIPLERGRTLLALGAVQRRLKQRAAARATLIEAASIFDEITAPLWAARARAELARIGGRAPGPPGLTVTERRVAELVARGMSNREVAAELFVTVRAVESTLTKTYAKLGARSRTELAARLRSD
jgi:DNA-binding NarL/FixJ family response regulator